MVEKLIAFGDLHLNWQASKVIFDQARHEGIETALTLGDEAHKIYPFNIGNLQDYERLYDEMRQFRDEAPDRTLICIVGDKTARVPEDLIENYVGTLSEYKTQSIIWQKDNLIAGHNGKYITEEYKDAVEGYDGYQPLIIFHAHSHSMGVLPAYKWLDNSEKVHWLDIKETTHKLEPRTVYWVNPGGNFYTNDQGLSVANFAIYDPMQQIVTLHTLPFNRESIEPTKGYYSPSGGGGNPLS